MIIIIIINKGLNDTYNDNNVHAIISSNNNYSNSKNDNLWTKWHEKKEKEA